MNEGKITLAGQEYRILPLTIKRYEKFLLLHRRIMLAFKLALAPERVFYGMVEVIRLGISERWFDWRARRALKGASVSEIEEGFHAVLNAWGLGRDIRAELKDSHE